MEIIDFEIFPATILFSSDIECYENFRNEDVSRIACEWRRLCSPNWCVCEVSRGSASLTAARPRNALIYARYRQMCTEIFRRARLDSNLQDQEDLFHGV
jgi:hypothetical protein